MGGNYLIAKQQIKTYSSHGDQKNFKNIFISSVIVIVFVVLVIIAVVVIACDVVDFVSIAQSRNYALFARISFRLKHLQRLHW